MQKDEIETALFKPSLGCEDVECYGESTLYQGYIHLKNVNYRFRRFDGGFMETQREVIQSRDVAIVLPYDPHTDTVVLIEQCRAGILIHPKNDSPWQLECVAGVNDTDESIEDVARRELWEEAGLTCTHLEKVLNYWVAPGISSEWVSFFCAKVRCEEAQTYAGLEHEAEDIATHRFQTAELKKMLGENHIMNGATLIALQWFSQHHEQLRQRWLQSETTP